MNKELGISNQLQPHAGKCRKTMKGAFADCVWQLISIHFSLLKPGIVVLFTFQWLDKVFALLITTVCSCHGLNESHRLLIYSQYISLGDRLALRNKLYLLREL
ncbi:UNVERIFIED_CONTAM: hypothetical protein K2H54_037652 [Gekko kuhli]